MEKIKSKKMLEELQNLKVGEKIFIPFNKDISNTIQLLSFQCQSYESLFKSYINSTCEEANAMNVDEFLKRYTELFTQMELYKQNILKVCLEDGFKYFMTNRFNYNFNYQLNLLEIFKIGGTN
jgi:hypothetical protein